MRHPCNSILDETSQLLQEAKAAKLINNKRIIQDQTNARQTLPHTGGTLTHFAFAGKDGLA